MVERAASSLATRRPTWTMPEGTDPDVIPSAEALDERMERLEARARLKMERGEPLDEEEASFFAQMPAHREIPAEVVREAARRHGGERPIDAATGRPHDADAALGLERGAWRRKGQ